MASTLAALAIALCADGAPVVSPDTSLATLPVAYYGANWNRTEENLEALSKLQIVILMQEDGECWLKCCPNARQGGNQCGDPPGAVHNGTALPGCGPECDQHGKQDAIFASLKARALAAGRREPHCMLYLNAVYDFPFSSTHQLGDTIDVLDVHGKVHVENVDPGVFPVTMFDFGKVAARQAWLDIVERAVVNGSSDGVYVDCGPTYGLKCTDPSNSSTCIAKRNGKRASLNEQVTPEQVEAYQQAKDATVLAGGALVGANGTWYDKSGSWRTHPPHRLGGNLIMIKPPTLAGNKKVWDAEQLIIQVQTAVTNFKYVIVGCQNCFSNPKTEKDSLPSQCSGTQVAAFLLALQPGAFLLCNGWDDKFALPLGNPLTPASQDSSTGEWTRSFADGTRVSWTNGTGTVTWAQAATVV